MFRTDELSLVLAALPFFQINSRQEYGVAGEMLTTLLKHLDELTPKQQEQAQRLATMVSRYPIGRDLAD